MTTAFTPDVLFEYLCVSTLLSLMSTRFQNNRTVQNLCKYFLAAFVTLCIMHKLYSYAGLLMVFVVFAIINYIETHKKLKSVFSGILTVFITLMFANICSIISYSIYNFVDLSGILPKGYFISTSVFVSGFFVDFLLKNKKLEFSTNKTMLFCAISNMLNFVLYMVLAPFIYNLDDTAMILFFQFVLQISVGLSFVLSVWGSQVEAAKSKKEAEIVLRDKKSQLEKERYNDVVALVHALRSRYNSLVYYIKNEDFEGVKNYFFDEIQPFYKNLDMTNKDIARKIELIGDESLHGVFSNLAYQCFFANIPFELEIADVIQPVEGIDISDLNTILGIFFENAVEESKVFENPQIVLTCRQNEDQTNIVITNAVGEKMNIDSSASAESAATTQSIINKRHGAGLKLVSEYRRKYPNVIISYGEKVGKYSQQIIINTNKKGSK